MPKIKVLHTADLHIGSSRTGIKNGRSEIINTFFRIINLCKTEQVDFLLISGDLFDTPFVDSELVSEITEAMSCIPDTIIAISPGNHDYDCPGSVYSTTVFPENVVVLSTIAESIDFQKKGVRLFGASFKKKYERNSLLSRPNNLSNDLINLCVLHGDFVSASSESDYNPITASDISTCGFDYLALGHIHKRSDIAKIGTTFCSYCGCPDGRGFDEYGSCGVYLGTIEKGSCNLAYVEMSSRKYIYDKTDITSCETSLSIATQVLAQLKEKYSEGFENNLYRISLIGNTALDFFPNISQIESIIGNEVSYIRITDETDTDLSDVSSIAKENSLRGIFVQKILQMAKSADDEQKELHIQALRIGLKAFEKGVTLHDN